MDPVASLLTGPGAGEILRAALAPTGGKLLSWHPEQVDYQPGRGSTAGYRVRVRWPDRRVTSERLAARTGEPPAGSLVVGDGQHQVAVWRFPHDPYLPGLAAAFDPAAVAKLLASFRLGEGRVRLAVRAYRPGRRAVVEAIGPAGRLFLKVVRPTRGESLHRRHRLCTAAGVPVPPSLGHTEDGVLVLQALPGRTMRDALRSGTAAMPSPVDILALLDRLPPELAEAPPRPSWSARAGHYAEVIAGILPEHAAPARRLAEAIT